MARSLKVNHTPNRLACWRPVAKPPISLKLLSPLKRAAQKGYTPILGNAWNDLEKQRAYLSMMAQKRVDGLLVMCSGVSGFGIEHAGRVPPYPMVVMD
ncbi:hypothetical protein LNO89_00165 [Klebsiella pneumoniae subsp. pneumoniae]|nr:hypothetical protein [Klebsiella pneumoniae subsp. pneumoniae]